MLKKLLITIFILAAGILLTKNFWVEKVLEQAIEQVTGFPAAIDKADLSLTRSQISIQGLRIRNPSGFPEQVFADVPGIFIDLDPIQYIFERQIYINEARFSLRELAVVRNHEGETNVSRLRTVVKEEKVQPKEEESTGTPRYYIERFVLTMGRVRYQDYSKSPPSDHAFHLNIEEEEIRNITSPADIIRIVLLKVAYQTTIGNLGVSIPDLKGQLDASLAHGRKFAAQGRKIVQQAGTAVTEGGKRIVGETRRKLEETDLSNAIGQAQEAASGLTQEAGKLLGSATGAVRDKLKPPDFLGGQKE